MDALKDMFNLPYYQHLAEIIQKCHKPFESARFIQDVTKELESLSLNQRMRHTSVYLQRYLPSDYKKSVYILSKAIRQTQVGYTNLVFPDFVGLYGLEDFDTSLEALKYFTQFGSSEFAIRQFLRRDFNRTIKKMYAWAEDTNHHVRRLSSEGSRPRLPWSFKLEAVIQTPEVTRPILDTLKTDAELYVRKSVANHLNDISKDNSDYMLEVVRRWDKSNKYTAWIVKHASRTLIKNGHIGTLSVLGFEKSSKVKAQKLTLKKAQLKLGETLEFEFDLISEKSKRQKLVVDYVVHYRKKSGALSPKVFKLTELNLGPNQKIHLTKKQLFKDFTTRKHYMGKHLLEIQVNGKRLSKAEFVIM